MKDIKQIQDAREVLKVEIERLRSSLEKPKKHKNGYSSRELDEWSNYYTKKNRIIYYKSILRQSYE
jgi:hypothetical protein